MTPALARHSRFTWVLVCWVTLGSALAPMPSAAAETLPAEVRGHVAKLENALDAWNVAEATAELDRLEKTAKVDEDVLHYYRGRIAFEEGRYADAIQELSEAGVEDQAGSYLRLAKETEKVVSKHLKVESEHFVFFYPPGKDALLAPHALETLEAARTAL